MDMNYNTPINTLKKNISNSSKSEGLSFLFNLIYIFLCGLNVFGSLISFIPISLSSREHAPLYSIVVSNLLINAAIILSLLGCIYLCSKLTPKNKFVGTLFGWLPTILLAGSITCAIFVLA